MITNSLSKFVEICLARYKSAFIVFLPYLLGLIKKFNRFTNYKFDVKIKWLTRKIRTLFHLKDKSLHPACKIYEGICICGENYIGETKRNVEIRSMEHNTPSDKSNPAKHLRDNIDHSFTWKVIYNALNRKLARKILEA